jgi:hypothetical protein
MFLFQERVYLINSPINFVSIAVWICLLSYVICMSKVPVQYMYSTCTVHVQYVYSTCTVCVQYTYCTCTVLPLINWMKRVIFHIQTPTYFLSCEAHKDTSSGRPNMEIWAFACVMVLYFCVLFQRRHIYFHTAYCLADIHARHWKYV